MAQQKNNSGALFRNKDYEEGGNKPMYTGPCMVDGSWDHSLWEDKPDSKRKGWIRTACGTCGKFVGYRHQTS